MSPEFYERIAHYYDLLHAGFEDDLTFLLSAVSRSGGKVLELGCGTGRLINPLARAGHFVTGIDSSPAMLMIAREKLKSVWSRDHERIHLVQADICHPPFHRQSFHLALAAHNTFMHLKPAEQLTALKAVRDCLSPAGRLILDLANPFVLWQMPDNSDLEPEQTLDDPVTGETVLVSSASRLDEEAQLFQVTWRFEISQTRDHHIQAATFTTDYHFLFPHEMERLIYDAGFALKELVGDYEHSPFAESSPRMIVIAEQREGRPVFSRA